MITYKTILYSWMVISSHTREGDKHKYLLEERQRNYHVSATLDEPLPYGEDRWIKLRMELECRDIEESGDFNFKILHHYCDTEKVEELKCTEANSFVVDGVPYC